VKHAIKNNNQWCRTWSIRKMHELISWIFVCQSFFFKSTSYLRTQLFIM
jgi:hypothetical protein